MATNFLHMVSQGTGGTPGMACPLWVALCTSLHDGENALRSHGLTFTDTELLLLLRL